MNLSSYFPQSDKLTLFIFKKIVAEYPSLNSHSLSVILSSEMVFMKIAVSRAHNSNDLTCAFPQDNIILQCATDNTLCTLPILSRRHVHKGQD